MQSASFTKKDKSIKKRSSKTPAEGAESKDSDKKAEQSLIDVMHDDANESEQSLIADNTSSMCGEDQTFGQGELKDVNEYLKGKVGADINAKKWLEGCEGLDDLEKSEVIIRLVYEVCLAKNIEYDLENDAAENEKGNKKDRNFDTRRVFEILKKVNRLLLPQDRRRLVEFVCQKDNVKLLEMICRQENKDGGGSTRIDQQYSWKGEFTGYKRLIDLLQYVLKRGCSSEIVLCIVKKVYGHAHVIYNGKQYLDDIQVVRIEGNFDYPDSVIEDCLKAAIELGYKDVVPVMLSGDIYYCIRLMKGEKFQEEKKAFDMIKETVAEVMSSWVNDEGQSFKDDVQRLLKKGIDIGIKDMQIKDLIAELGDQGIKLTRDDKSSKERLVEKLKEKEVGEVRLSKTVVGGLISTLFFNYQDELVEVLKDKELFKLGVSIKDKGQKEKEINELNKRIDSKSFVKEKVLEKIKLLNSSSHIFNGWFFREVLSAIVNGEEKLGKLKAVCTAICKEKVEKLLKDVKVGEDVVGALKLFGVEPNQTSIPRKIHSEVAVIPHFTGDIKNLVKGIKKLNDLSLMADEILEIVKGLASNKVPAFSGLSRRTIINLKNKRDKIKDEAKDLKEKVLKIMGEIKQGIDILAKSVNDSPGSKAANSKGFMQNNCGQGGKSYYRGTGSYLNSQNSPRGLGC
ncbi:uncharacterized protein NPIL_366151 [Nephila pilipes]|uniref:Uncharacterized protein n=1 Tax=Nephila pilipes TaxID=299642 RepID=A0A8X6MP89_NEPPI|nr:uncharacterized protein NPIL_366151 [Nephila pilipes]